MQIIDPVVQVLVQARRSSQAATAAPTLPDAATAYAVQDGVAREFGWFGDAMPRH